MGRLEAIFEAQIELCMEGIVHLIRLHVPNRFLRGVLYVLTGLLVVAVVYGAIIGILYLGATALEWLSTLIS